MIGQRQRQNVRPARCYTICYVCSKKIYTVSFQESCNTLPSQPFVTFLTHALLCAVYSLVAIILTPQRVFPTVPLPSASGWCVQNTAPMKMSIQFCFVCNLGWCMVYLHCVVVEQDVYLLFSAVLHNLNSALFCQPNSRSNDANIRYPIYFIKCLNSINKNLQINLFTLSH